MIGFLIGATLLVLAVLALFLRSQAPSSQMTGPDRTRLNSAIYRDQLAEIERDRANGVLTEADCKTAREEIQRRMIEDGSNVEAAPVAAPARRTLIAISVLLPTAAALIYLLLGNPAAFNPPPPSGGEPAAADVERMVATLAARMEKEPDNLEGWVMLGRSYAVLGRMEEADGAFARALKIDPENAQALAMSGLAAAERQDFKRAVVHWEKLRKQIPDGSEEARAIDENLQKAKAAIGAKPGR